MVEIQIYCDTIMVEKQNHLFGPRKYGIVPYDLLYIIKNCFFTKKDAMINKTLLSSLLIFCAVANVHQTRTAAPLPVYDFDNQWGANPIFRDPCMQDPAKKKGYKELMGILEQCADKAGQQLTTLHDKNPKTPLHAVIAFAQNENREFYLNTTEFPGSELTDEALIIPAAFLKVAISSSEEAINQKVKTLFPQGAPEFGVLGIVLKGAVRQPEKK